MKDGKYDLFINSIIILIVNASIGGFLWTIYSAYLNGYKGFGVVMTGFTLAAITWAYIVCHEKQGVLPIAVFIAYLTFGPTVAGLLLGISLFEYLSTVALISILVVIAVVYIGIELIAVKKGYKTITKEKKLATDISIAIITILYGVYTLFDSLDVVDEANGLIVITPLLIIALGFNLFYTVRINCVLEAEKSGNIK